MASLVKYAVGYANLGWFVLPVDPLKKKPLILWAQRKDKRPTANEIKGWFTKWPDARIGILTGAASGFDAVDLDGPEAIQRFEANVCEIPGTIMQTTGRKEGGCHLLFKHSANGLRNAAGKGADKGIDLRTTGGFVVVAPSLHKTGKRYAWGKIDPLADGLDDLLEMPQEAIEHFKKKSGGNGEKQEITLEPVECGVRNDSLTRLVGKWASQGMDIETAYLTAAGWNLKLAKSLDDQEVATTVESVYRAEARNHPERAVSDEIAEERAAIIEESEVAQGRYNLTFPGWVMSGVAGNFASLYDEYLESPKHFFYMAFLTLFGLSVADKLYLLSQRRQQPRLYTILLGESAVARKSTALEETDMFFREFLEDGAVAVCRGAASGEGMAKLMGETDKVLLYYDELKAFVSKCEIKNSSLLTAANTLFELNRYENKTTEKAIKIENGYAAMLAASTTDTYVGLFTKKFVAIGFNNRLFLVPGDSNKCIPIPEPIPEDDLRALRYQLRDRLQIVNKDGAIGLDKDAKERWNEYYTQLKWDKSPYTKRLDTYGMRLIPLIAINDLKTTADLETIEKVITLIEWQYAVRRVYDPIDQENTIAKMEEKVRRAILLKPKWAKRELQRKVNYSEDGIWVWDKAVENLISNDEMIFDAKSKTYAKTAGY